MGRGVIIGRWRLEWVVLGSGGEGRLGSPWKVRGNVLCGGGAGKPGDAALGGTAGKGKAFVLQGHGLFRGMLYL
eukprot:scaffold12786_cov90-Isochrysis_galbana.AAC.1